MHEVVVSNWGERKLLKKIFKRFIRAVPRLKVGMGDDAAVVQPRQGWNLVYTTDTLVEKVDFDFKYTTFEQVGHKAMAANLSDIAAMGAFPAYFLLTLGMPSQTAVSDVMNLFSGAHRLARANGVSLIGGDLTDAPVIMVGITLIGEIKPSMAVLRSTASGGDLIYVTGTLGDSRAGLDLLKRGEKSKAGSSEKVLFQRHLTPYPRISEGQLLSQKRLATAMMDISDGLFTDILNLTEASEVGAEINLDSLPVSPSMVRYASKRKLTPSIIALTGGEDFELLFSVSPKNSKRVNQLIESEKIVAKAIGKITREKGIRYVNNEGKAVNVKTRGFEHFTLHT